MPTILRRNGFAFRVYPNDHRPAHVHVIKGDGEVVIELGGERTPPSIREVYGMRDRDVVSAFGMAVEFKTELLAAWKKIHEAGRD